MYGFVFKALEKLVVRDFGEEKWNIVKAFSSLNLCGKEIIDTVMYDDSQIMSLLDSAIGILGLTRRKLMETFGENFFHFCIESGYESVLKSIGRDLYQFISGLDRLHDHLAYRYPGMRAPTFSVSAGQEPGTLVLNYFSERDGLQFMVAGMIKAAARLLFTIDVDIALIKTPTSENDSAEFLIQLISSPDLNQNLLAGSNMQVPYLFGQNLFSDLESLIDPDTFRHAFPFHVIFDRNLTICQCGNSISQLVSGLEAGLSKFNIIFVAIRPVIELSFECILSRLNTVFVLKTKEWLTRYRHLSYRRSMKPVVSRCNSIVDDTSPSFVKLGNDLKAMSRKDNLPADKYIVRDRSITIDSNIGHKSQQNKHPKMARRSSLDTAKSIAAQYHIEEEGSLRLKGQMMYLKETDKLLFLCSPRILSLDCLSDKGMYMSDIPIHDATRDIILMSQQFSAEQNLIQDLEIVTDKLQETSRNLEYEQRLADRLLYSILPETVANDLRAKKVVAAQKYDLVTIIFCGIVNFDSLVNNTQEPIMIVNLLNQIYTKFDHATDKNPHVYKVETVGDKYMVVSGLPKQCDTHAHNIAYLALDMHGVAGDIIINGQNISITTGIHSGEVVAGIVGQKLPRYCLFGNTVNLASRCETTGIKGKINLTENVYQILSQNPDPKWRFDLRGPINMKGKKEPMTCYFLTEHLKTNELNIIRN